MTYGTLRRLANALAALIPLVLRRLGQAAGAGRTHEGVRARALRGLMAFIAAAVRCPSLAAERRRVVLARRVGQAFRFGFRHFFTTYLDRIRQDRAWATRRRSHLPRLERSGGRRGHFALLIARRREETDLRLVAGFARPTDVDFFICARTRPAL